VPTSFENLSDEVKSARLLDYVQGRLTTQEKEAIDTAILNDPKWAEELAYYKGLSNASEPAPVPAGQEFGWARLSKAIDQETESMADPVIAANDNNPFWKLAAFAMGLVAIVQAGFLLIGTPASISEEPIYVPVAQTDHLEVRIIFTDSATSADISTLLQDIDAEIVAGPSAIGLYDVRFTSEDLRNEGLKELRGATAIIESVTFK